MNDAVIELPGIRLTQPLAVQLSGASMTPLLLSNGKDDTVALITTGSDIPFIGTSISFSFSVRYLGY